MSTLTILQTLLDAYHGSSAGYVPPVVRSARPYGVKLVGLWSAVPQSGKSTAAGSLLGATLDATGYPTAEVVSLATPPRRLVEHLLQIMGVSQKMIDERVWNGVDKELPIPGVGKSVVELLILVGTTVGREQISETIWVDAWKRNVEEAFKEGNELVICDDVRFRNEADAIRAMGGVMIGIERPGAAPASAQRAAAEGHLTRSDMDALVLNDTGKAIFEARVVQTARHLGVDL